MPIKKILVGEEFYSNRLCYLLVRLPADENRANLLVCNAYIDGELIASASACEAFVEGYSNNFATMTIPVPPGTTVKIERDRMSGDAGTVTISVLEC